MRSPLFTDTVTLYNHYRQDRADCWKRTVLRGVQWAQKIVRTAGSTGSVVVTTETSITIPDDVTGYASPQDFAAAADKTALWTLAPDDLVMLGESSVEIVNEVTEDDVCALGAVTIRSVKDNTLRPRLKNRKVVAI